MFELVFFLILIVTGYVIGQLLEKNHYKSILRREAALRNLPLIASKILPQSFGPCQTELVTGNVVISIDFFKKIVAGLRMIVGGRVSTYESLIDRARREALLRMREQARRRKAKYIFNVKMETSSISKGQRDSIGAVEVLAYGTAVIQGNVTGTGSVSDTPDMMNLRPR